MILIKVQNNIDYFIKKNIKNNIEMYEIDRNKDCLYVKVNEENLEEIIRLNYYSKIEVIKYYGLKAWFVKIKQYYFDFIMLLFFFAIIYFLSNVIVKIEIKHENKTIVKEVENILKEKNIKLYTIKKDLKTLNQISDEIMYEHNDFIDWIAINNIGMKYVISIEERIQQNIIEEEATCHITAKRDGVITNFKFDKGISLIEKGSLVKKGDILISGEIKLNDEVKDNVCANGEVMAETWYRINVTLPLKYNTTKRTGNSRYNFIMNNNYFYKKNYNEYDEEKVVNIGPLKIVKQIETITTEQRYSTDEAYEVAIKEAKNKLLTKIGKNNQIISEKVLKETINNSTIELELFITVNESIGEQTIYKVSDVSDTEPNI